MPTLTRGAAKQLCAVGERPCTGGPDETVKLALREPVTGKAEAVWAHRGGVDVYSRTSRAQTERPNVDHALEVQLAEVALVRAFGAERAQMGSMATAQATELLRGALNGLGNLNVTSAKINQAKKGPVTAAINRLGNERLRTVSIEQLARQGRARWLVDDGTWARIEGAVVAGYDDADARLRGDGVAVDALPSAATLVEGTLDELHRVLGALGLH